MNRDDWPGHGSKYDRMPGQQMTVVEFESRAEELLRLIHDKLKSGCYRVKPARRVLIPKAGSSKKRKLGIPAVMDRVVSQSLNLVLGELVDPTFTASNFGYRRAGLNR